METSELLSLKEKLLLEQKEKLELQELLLIQQEEICELKNKLNYQCNRETGFSINNLDFFLDKAPKFEKHKILKALKESSDFIQLVLDTTPNFLCVRDTKGVIKLLNKSFATILFNDKKKNVKQLNVEDFYSKQEEKNKFLSSEKQVIDELKELKFQETFTTKKGEELILETIKKPLITSEGEVYVFGISIDITEQVRAKEQLQQQEEKFRLLSENSSDITSLIDKNFKVLYTSHASETMLGYTSQELLKIGPADIIHPDDRDDLIREVKEKVLTNAEKLRVQFRYIRKDGTPVWVESNIKPVVEADGSIGKFQTSTRDITDRKVAQLALKKSIELRENFLANMSHEIRTPMQGILGMAEVLNRTNLDESQKNNLNIIRQSANNLLVIINDILDYSKIREGKLGIETIAFDINEVLESAYKMLELKAADKDLNFILEPMAINYPLIGDPFRLNQVIINLINNAIKFTEEGCVTIGGKVLEETEHKCLFEIYVKDTGIGIAKDHQKMVFEEFSQASSYTSRKFGGTGLGLNICKKLLELQGSHLNLESKVGEGSTFKFTMSLDKADYINTIKFEDGELNYHNVRNLKILLAEDNAVNVVIAQTFMSRWGVSVDVAKNGNEAVAMAEKNKYDVILMDIQMPELSGPSATRLIRQFNDREKAAVPIIALTANVLQQDVKKYNGAGMNDFLSKPYSEKELFHKITKQVTVASDQSVQPAGDFQSYEKITADFLTRKFDLKICNPKYLLSLTDGDLEFTQEMINLFLTQAEEEIGIIAQAVKDKNPEGIRKYAHKLKSSSVMIGAQMMSEQLKVLEVGKVAAEELPPFINDLQTTYKAVKKELQLIISDL